MYSLEVTLDFEGTTEDGKTVHVLRLDGLTERFESATREEFIQNANNILDRILAKYGQDRSSVISAQLISKSSL